MKIYNQGKTQELNINDLDREKGYLKPDKKFVQHHEAVEAKEAVYKDKPEKLANGSTQVWKDLVMPAVEAREAWDEYEDIQVYVPYNVEELKNMLRAKRTLLLNAFDKWEKAVLRGRENESNAVMDWYYDILDLKECAFNNIPECIKYYL